MTFLLIFLSFSFSQTHTINADISKNDFHLLIENVQSGDSIIFESGTYKFNNIMIEKSLTLIGKGETIFDAEFKDKIIEVSADSFFVENITFKNAKMSFIDDNAGLKLKNLKKGSIKNSTFIDNFFGIYLAKSKNVIIENNKIWASSKRETLSGNAIHLWYCKNITIKKNEVFGHRDGIYFEFVEESIIRENFSHNNIRYGLHFMFSNSCKYVENYFLENNSGIAVMYSKFIEMERNRFVKSQGQTAFGLLFKEIYDSKILNNIFEENSVGFYGESSTRNHIEGNTFKSNGWAMRIMSNSMENIIEKNNFIENIFDISTNSRNNYNIYKDNYWSAYKGYDLNKDDIGDVEYRPVKLFSIVVEKQPIMLILTHSIFMNILNLSEDIIPVLTPENLADKTPRMSPWKW